MKDQLNTKLTPDPYLLVRQVHIYQTTKSLAVNTPYVQVAHSFVLFPRCPAITLHSGCLLYLVCCLLEFPEHPLSAVPRVIMKQVECGMDTWLLQGAFLRKETEKKKDNPFCN